MLIARTYSSLSRCFSDTGCADCPVLELSCLTNEPCGFTLAVKSDKTGNVTVYTDLPDDTAVYHVGSVHAGYTAHDDRDDWYEKDARSGLYPDILYRIDPDPADGFDNVPCAAGEWLSFYIEYNAAGNASPGVRQIGYRVVSGSERVSGHVRVTVYPAALPEQRLVYTNWFHSDCLASYYKVPVFSDEYWELCAGFMRMAARHGANMILTPLFTPPLDTAVGGERPTVQLVDVRKDGDVYSFGFDKLDKWISLAMDCGFKYFEMSHLFTQWGAEHAPKIIALENGVEKRVFGWETDAAGPEYTAFLRQLSVPLKNYIEANGLHDKVAFHTSDEPGRDDFTSYAKASGIVAELFGEYKRIDALSDFDYYKKGLIDTPVPYIGSAPAFAGNVPELWLYYCGSPCNGYMPNRLLAMPLARARSIGLILYKYDAKGFLHWGYNFYYTQYSTREVDPFTETDAGGKFPAGDSFVVYPGENGKAIPSLRLKAFYEGIRDYESLRALESRMPRQEIIKMLEDSFGSAITERNYPKDPAWYLNTAKKVRELLADKKIPES